MFRSACFGVLAMLSMAGAALADARHVVYPRPVSDNDSQYTYDYELLRVALDKTRQTFGPASLRASTIGMTEERAAEEICSGNSIVNIFARSTSVALEARFIPIRIPLDKGLLSYRIFLIRANSQADFAAVRTIDELRKWRIGSFHSWTDARILQKNGFSVVKGNSYEGLFRMLVAQRFDFFSRSVDEAYREFDERKLQLPGLMVEDTILVYFPSTRYFFVRRDAEGEKLARRVESGLEQMIRDGSFEALFQHYKGALIKRAHLGTRKVFYLENPDLPPATPRNRGDLWFKPLAMR